MSTAEQENTEANVSNDISDVIAAEEKIASEVQKEHAKTSYPVKGVMLKKTGKFQIWKQRYFVMNEAPIDPALLRTYHNKNVVSLKSSGGAKFVEKNKALFSSIANAVISGKGIVLYYENETSETPIGLVDLRQVSQKGALKFVDRAHVYFFMQDKKPLFVSADTKDDMEIWARAFDDADLETVDEQSEAYQEIMAKLSNGTYYEDLEPESAQKNSLLMSKFSTLFRSVAAQKQEEPFSGTSIDQDSNEEEHKAETETENKDDTEIVDSLVIEDSTEAMLADLSKEGSVESPAAHEEAAQEEAAAVEERILPEEPEKDDSDKTKINIEVEKFALPENIVKKGWLFKQSDYWKVWNSRYVVLHSDESDIYQLSYFRPQENLKHLILVFGADTKTEANSTATSDDMFSLSVSSGGKTVTFGSKSKDDVESWISIIQGLFPAEEVQAEP
jgi:hypothetical protein